jgi:hypothetical protein
MSDREQKLFDALRELVEQIESGNGRDDHRSSAEKSSSSFAMREPSLPKLRAPDASPTPYNLTRSAAAPF